MTVDGMDIRNGIYLSFLGAAYSSAQTALDEENTDGDTSDGSTEEETVPITQETIQGKSGSQWIKDETMMAVRRFVAVQRKCDEYGILLTDDEIAEINTELNETWDTENQYLMYVYGFNTMGEFYESQGIGIESMREILRVNKLQDKLFMHFYGKGGSFEVTESEIDEYLKENFATVKMQTFSYTDAMGNTLEEDDDIKAVKDKAQNYADRINNGEKPADIFYEYNLSRAQEAAEKRAETEYKEDNEEGLTKDEWIKQQVEAADVQKAESEEDLDRFISKEDSSYDEKTTEYIFNAPSDGKATVFEADKGVYIIIKSDITEKTSWKEENHENILTRFKGDDFRSMVDLFGQNYDVTADESLINKKYSPEKLDPQ